MQKIEGLGTFQRAEKFRFLHALDRYTRSKSYQGEKRGILRNRAYTYRFSIKAGPKKLVIAR